MGCRTRPRIKGVTLVELLVTIAVLAILLAAATPSFADFIDRYRLRGAVDDVVSVISIARAEAVKGDRDVNVSIGGSTSAWCIGANAAVEPVGGAPAADAAACNCSVADSCMVGGQQLRIATGTHGGVAVGAVGDDFSFDSKLGVTVDLETAAATFTSPSRKYDLQVNVNPLGQASVCRPASKPAIPGVQPCAP